MANPSTTHKISAFFLMHSGVHESYAMSQKWIPPELTYVCNVFERGKVPLDPKSLQNQFFLWPISLENVKEITILA